MHLVDHLLIRKSEELDKKITQQEAAKAVGTSPAMFGLLLSGRSSGTRSEKVLKNMAKYFGITLERLKASIEQEKEAQVD